MSSIVAWALSPAAVVLALGAGLVDELAQLVVEIADQVARLESR
jgi:hypothetical protein